VNVDHDQTLAFRRAAHHLHEPTDALTAVAACGLQDTPPQQGATLALHARSPGAARPPGPADGDPGSVGGGVDLVIVNAMRRAPFLVPRSDLPVFTTALVPADEAGLKSFVGSKPAGEVAAAGLGVREALDLVSAAARDALADGPLELVPFHQALRERLPETVLPWCRGCQSHHVRSGFWRGLGAVGVTEMPSKSTWALADAPSADPDEARREAARRFLRTHGPATHTELAAWAGCGPAHAKLLLGMIETELDEVRRAGRPTWALTEDIAALESPPPTRGVRLLGGFDPYVAQPDRDALVPDDALRRRLFPAIGRPNVVLVDGLIAGLWRARKRGRSLEVELDWLGPEVDVADELRAVAALRGCDDARVVATE
jgi:Winged helix DNA-binding domain